ncbi:MAG: type II toxin-antitoxin system HicA family toxin [Defluviitaleaceae bacterium]|nr:type II toxin-antitoxin system HicA family toxin [Defluviitaleaceae bacterium]
MGSKYPVLRPSEVIKALEKFGFVFKSQKGSHAKYIKVSSNLPTRTVIIPMHNEIAKGTLQSILEQAGLSLEEFMKKL